MLTILQYLRLFLGSVTVPYSQLLTGVWTGLIKINYTYTQLNAKNWGFSLPNVNACMVEPIIINGQHLEIVKSAKILCMTLTENLKWNPTRCYLTPFSNTFDICKYNFLRWIERLYFYHYWAHKTRDKAQQSWEINWKENFPRKKEFGKREGLFWAACLSMAIQ